MSDEKKSLTSASASDAAAKGGEEGGWSTTDGPRTTIQLITDNMVSAITVSLVSVSLSIALGIASGTTPAAGLTTAIWGGLTFGILGSSPYNIVGPAGALSGMLNSYTVLWTKDILPWISLFSGGIIALVYLGKLHKYMLFMPNSVFEGFTVAVAVIIGLGQLNFALGLTPAVRHPEFILNVHESVKLFKDARWESMVLFFPMVVALYFLMKATIPIPGTNNVPLNKIPWSVILPFSSVILGYTQRDETVNTYDATGQIIGTEVVHKAWNLWTLRTKYAGKLDASLVTWPDVAVLKAADISGVLGAAGAVAFVAVLETLISAKIAQNKSKAQQKKNPVPFDEDQETGALVVAHIACGALGAIPPTGVFVRTNLNLDLNANHKVSQLMNAIFVLIITAVAMPVFQYLPQPTVAAILVVASVRMFPNHLLARLWAVDKTNFAIMVITALVAIVEDPVMGLCLGTFLALLLRARESNVAVEQKSAISTEAGDVFVITLRGAVTYMNCEALSNSGRADLQAWQHAKGYALDVKLEDSSTRAPAIVVDLSSCTELDLDGADWVGRMIKSTWGISTFPALMTQNQTPLVYFAGARDNIKKTLQDAEQENPPPKSSQSYFGAKDAFIPFEFVDTLAAAVNKVKSQSSQA